mgnify:CR=1 FL=1
MRHLNRLRYLKRPIMIDSNAVEPAPAGTEYTASPDAPVLVPTFGFANLLKSLAIYNYPL